MYPEPWHLSYWPVAKKMQQELTIDMLAEAINNAEMLSKKRVLERLPELFDSHVKNICVPHFLTA